MMKILVFLSKQILKTLSLLYLYKMNNAPLGIDLYLQPTYFVDCEQPDIRRFVKNTIGKEIDKKKIAILLYVEML